MTSILTTAGASQSATASPLDWLDASDANLTLALAQSSPDLSIIGLRLEGVHVNTLGETIVASKPVRFVELQIHIDGQATREYLNKVGLIDVRKITHTSDALDGVAIEVVPDALHGAGPVPVPAVIESDYTFDTDYGDMDPGSAEVVVRFFADLESAQSYAKQLEVHTRLELNVELLQQITENTALIDPTSLPVDFAARQIDFIAGQTQLVRDILAKACSGQ